MVVVCRSLSHAHFVGLGGKVGESERRDRVVLLDLLPNDHLDSTYTVYYTYTSTCEKQLVKFD